MDGEDGTYPPLQTSGTGLLEVGRARFFALHMAALKSPPRPLGRCSESLLEKKMYWFRHCQVRKLVFVLQLPVAAVLSKVQIKFVALV